MCKSKMKVNLVESQSSEERREEEEFSEVVSRLSINMVTEANKSDTDSEVYCTVSNKKMKVRKSRSVPAKRSILINNQSVLMEVDTGAAVTIVPKDFYLDHFKNVSIEPCSMKLKAISGESLKLLGKLNVNVKLDPVGHSLKLPLIVTNSNNNFCPLLGRNWLDALHPEWRVQLDCTDGFTTNPSQTINLVSGKEYLEKLKIEFPKVFSNKGIFGMEGIKAQLVLKENASMVFHAA